MTRPLARQALDDLHRAVKRLTNPSPWSEVKMVLRWHGYGSPTIRRLHRELWARNQQELTR